MPKRIIVPPTSANGRNGSGEDEQLQQVEDSFGVFTDKYPIIVELGLDLAALVKQI
jgi:hypothetical protein